MPQPPFVDPSVVPSCPSSSPEVPSSQPLQVYQRRWHCTIPPLPAAPTPTPEADPSSLDLSIAFRKGTRTSTPHPISKFVSYDSLSSNHRTFALALSSKSIPKNYQEALTLPQWKETMDVEMQVLLLRGT